MTENEFIEKAKVIHSDENIDYSFVEYKDRRTKVKLIDPVYGEFWQTPENHLRGHSHPSRRKDKISRGKSLNEEEVIERFKQKHDGEGLDYSKVKYVNMHTKVCIIDPIYGEFWQEPAAHLKGCGHPQRAIEKNAENQRYTTDKFKELCSKIHQQYDLSKVDYKSSQEKVCIICPKHGEFMAYPDALLQGKGCPTCGNHLSDGENEIYDFVCNLVGKENVIKGDRSILGGNELDILIPKYGVAFEFDGLRWHSEKFGKDKNYHLGKTEKCLEKGIKLIHIFEDEWIFKKKIVLNKIKHILKFNDSALINARSCVIEKVEKDGAERFLNENHIQGFSNSSVYLGLYHEELLVAVMSFLKCGNDEYELNRYATDLKYLVRGGASKLFSWFVKNYNPVLVKTFLDRRWVAHDINLYDKMGFFLDCVLPPNYSYTKGQYKRFHKFGFRKQILHKKYGLPLTMTENEMAKALGYDKIWDCGLFKYVWINPEKKEKYLDGNK